ncbi:hypothetical protein [Allofournierella massiliensis]|uniref:hypothetical protein n=1 Tax=Allofournierella massiliensis TaxID=1650663 RepID=UPI0039A1D2D7
MKTLVMYGEAFGAEEMIPVTAEKGHLVTSFCLSMMKPVYDLMDQLIEGGAVNGQKFSVDPPAPWIRLYLRAFCRSWCSNSCIPSSRTTRRSCGRWALWRTTPSPSPALCLRWETSRSRGRS